jgi:UDP-3-O-[3-hydroxymyristoyl] glucosamine N-acyltransferase
MKLSEIAARLGCRLVGDGDVEIQGVRGIEEARTGDLTFVANRKYLSKIKSTRASAIILAHDAPESTIPSLRSDNPYLAFAKSIELFYQPPPPPAGIHPSAVISPTAKIGRNPSIGAHVVVADDVFLGDNVRLYPNVSIYTGAALGDDCIIHANTVIREYVRLGHRVIVQNGAVIGGDGFGFARQSDGAYYKIVQSGTVIIEDDVEIGANTAVDRATVGATVIKRGAKLDNLVHIGHGCVIGENTLMAAQVGLAGSTKVGRNVMLGGQVGSAGHLTIGDNAGVTAQSGLPHDVESNALVSGSPAIDHALWRKASALYGKLPELAKRLRALEDEINKLKPK